jgi:hypothetical protein
MTDSTALSNWLKLDFIIQEWLEVKKRLKNILFQAFMNF